MPAPRAGPARGCSSAGHSGLLVVVAALTPHALDLLADHAFAHAFALQAHEGEHTVDEQAQPPAPEHEGLVRPAAQLVHEEEAEVHRHEHGGMRVEAELAAHAACGACLDAVGRTVVAAHRHIALK